MQATASSRLVKPPVSLALSIVAIAVCGGMGALAGVLAIGAIGIGGVGGALVATAIALVVATLLWAAGVALLRALRWLQ